jgi:hypothetical protein
MLEFFVNSCQFLMYEGNRWRNFFILKSNHILKMEEKLFMQLTTKHNFKGVLCTLGTP